MSPLDTLILASYFLTLVILALFGLHRYAMIYCYLSSTLPLGIKIEAAFHLTANFAYPLMLLLSVLMLPKLIIGYERGLHGMLIVDVPLLLGATLSVSSFYLVSQREVFGTGWKGRLKYLPAVLALGIGLSVTGTKAVLEALLGRSSDFARTPKYRVESVADEWRRKRYRGTLDFAPLVEMLFAAYFAFAAYYAVRVGLYGVLPFILLFEAGFLYAAVLSLLQETERLALVDTEETHGTADRR